MMMSTAASGHARLGALAALVVCDAAIVWVGPTHLARRGSTPRRGCSSTPTGTPRCLRRGHSGDILFKSMVGWREDAFPNDHPATLDALKKMDMVKCADAYDRK